MSWCTRKVADIPFYRQFLDRVLSPKILIRLLSTDSIASWMESECQNTRPEQRPESWSKGSGMGSTYYEPVVPSVEKPASSSREHEIGGYVGRVKSGYCEASVVPVSWMRDAHTC